MRDEQLNAWTVEAHDADGSGQADGPGQVPPMAATVPGSVHVDLIAAGLIDDLTVRGRDDDQLWVSETPWRYRTTIRRPELPFEHAVLVFEGIDTIARVSVGEQLRLTSRNMFRRHEIDVTADLAADASVQVTVDLDPVLPVVQAAELANPLPRPAEYWRPFNQVRKMACSFGWDWGPTTMSAGLWRPVHLLSWSGGRFADVHVVATPGAETGSVTVDVGADGAADEIRVVVTGTGPDREPLAAASAPVRDGRAKVTVEVPGARLWWPHTEGDSPLYEVATVLVGPGGDVLDEHHVRVGFRTVEAVQEPDDEGISFAIRVNGQRVWVRGLDWIPDDPFPSRITPDRYRARLAEAVALGANAVRVWGGGIYEDEAFYDACDEFGLLVIQDFLFACAAYPEDDATVDDVRAEVGDNVRRLRHRASLAMWCGNNENLWGLADWGWAESLAGRPWGLRYYREILPELVARLDGTRPYVPGSPFSPEQPGPGDAVGTTFHPNDPTRGMQHIWDVWNERDYTDYETWRPRFVSEFGYQAPASWPTLETAVDGPLDPADPALLHHQRAGDGAQKLQAGLERHLPTPPSSGVPWYFATQLLQARAVTTGVTHLRSLHDYCSGAIWWQLNDIWPSISWAVLDVRGRRKLAWHAMRRAFDPRLVTIAAGADGARVVLVNDTAQPWTERLVVRSVTAGAAAVVLERDVEVAPHDSWSVEIAAEPSAVVVLADIDGRRAQRWLVPDTELALDLPDALVTVAPADGGSDGVEVTGVEVTVVARTLLRDVCLLAELELPDAVVTGQLTTLLPGERTTFQVLLPAGAPVPPDVDWPALVWSDNRLRHSPPADQRPTGQRASSVAF